MTHGEEDLPSSQGRGTAHPEGWGESPDSDVDHDSFEAARVWARGQMDDGFPEEVVLEALVTQGWPYPTARRVMGEARGKGHAAGAEGGEAVASSLGALWDEGPSLDAYMPRRRRHLKVVLVTIIVLLFSAVLAVKFAGIGASVSEQQAGLTEEAITATVEALQGILQPPP